MGKLLIGHYGEPPDAESVQLPLQDCHRRLGLKPSDFVSAEEPDFFRKARGAKGKYLVFALDAEEVKGAAVWRVGYYLLPLEAADVLKSFNKQDLLRGGATARPFDLESKTPPTEAVLLRAQRWAVESQPLLFNCQCPQLILRLDPPWAFRREWTARLTCAKRCQPPLKTKI